MPERDIRLYLDDISESGQAIFAYVQGMVFDEFCRDRKTFSAVIREFEIIGEAVGKLPDGIKEHYSEGALPVCALTRVAFRAGLQGPFGLRRFRRAQENHATSQRFLPKGPCKPAQGIVQKTHVLMVAMRCTNR